MEADHDQGEARHGALCFCCRAQGLVRFKRMCQQHSWLFFIVVPGILVRVWKPPEYRYRWRHLSGRQQQVSAMSIRWMSAFPCARRSRWPSQQKSLVGRRVHSSGQCSPTRQPRIASSLPLTLRRIARLACFSSCSVHSRLNQVSLLVLWYLWPVNWRLLILVQLV